MLKPVRHWKGT